MGACLGSTYKGVDAMGRGRQKAKQTKVARELKYYSPNTDYTALQRELGNGEAHPEPLPADESDAGEDEQDDWPGWASDGRH
jgi:hypothetical protein